ncbi:MAG TPA: endonuclease III domain-containing protein [Desulfuromonadales bacterium]|nr:endonuclease III domain-containing protein [Desulfuromonadales bacterium]
MSSTTEAGTRLLAVFNALHEHFGPRRWWPADSAFEVAVGAILTQNTAWRNVEQAIANLKGAVDLSPDALAGLSRNRLEELIRPAGFFRQKSRYLEELTTYLLREWNGDLIRLCTGPLETARRRLLALKGIGPETADSILLYAAGRPTFVVDAYTYRIFSRLQILLGDESYQAVRLLFMRNLPKDASLFNEFHALIVQHAKTYCRKRRPDCQACPLLAVCPHGQTVSRVPPPGL